MSRLTRFLPLPKAGWWLVVLLAAWLIGCGGGDGPTAGVGVGGTGGSGGTGPITGLGSIFVNDVRFDDSGVSALDEDGHTLSPALGMLVDVSAGPTRVDAQGFTAATASSVRVIQAIQGPVQGTVTTADNVTGTVAVLGQTVQIDGATLYKDLPQGLLSLTGGTTVTVFGLYDTSQQQFLATRIEAAPGLSAYMVRARVGAVANSGGHPRFNVDQLIIDGRNLASQPSVGQLIRVKLSTTANGDGSWMAQSVVAVTQTARADGTALKIEGVVSDFVSLGNFKVDGQQVSALAYDGSGGSVANGSRVEVEGSVSDGTLVASKLSFKTSGGASGAKAKLIGAISAVNTGTQRFTLKGLLVLYDPTPVTGTRFDDGVASDLTDGRYVEAEGTLSPDGSVLTATRIRLR